MDKDFNVRQITKLYKSCNKCGLPTLNCICNDILKVKSKAQIWILSSEKEFLRPSNTARILKLINKDSTEVFLWKRTEKPIELINKIESNEYDVYLLFPVDDETRHRETEFIKSNKIPAFIIIDGTWKEAKKILRKSDYLKEIPMLSLKPFNNSNFILRRNIVEGTLCTIETAMEVINLNEEDDISIKIQDTFEMFQKAYKNGQSGHKAILKEK